MNTSIEKMMNEHRLIVQVLAALDALAQRLRDGASVPREDIGKFATFFREFADKCHHGKEEDRLFAMMNQHGFPQASGPVAVMLMEHTAGRAYVRALAEIGARSGPLSAQEISQAACHAREFVSLLLSHIHKEDYILYPLAQQALPPHSLDRLDEDCEAFDRQMGEAQIEGLRELAQELIAAYEPEPERLEAASRHLGCHVCA